MKLFMTLLLAGTFTVAIGCDSGSKGPSSKTTPSGEAAEGSITLNEPDKLEIKQGETKDVEINIERNEYKGDVELMFAETPGLKVLTKDLTLKDDKSSTTVKIMAEETAVVGAITDGVKITAKPTTGKTLEVMMPVQIMTK